MDCAWLYLRSLDITSMLLAHTSYVGNADARLGNCRNCLFFFSGPPIFTDPIRISGLTQPFRPFTLQDPSGPTNRGDPTSLAQLRHSDLGCKPSLEVLGKWGKHSARNIWITTLQKVVVKTWVKCMDVHRASQSITEPSWHMLTSLVRSVW
jgi:hypothetical protein